MRHPIPPRLSTKRGILLPIQTLLARQVCQNSCRTLLKLTPLVLWTVAQSFQHLLHPHIVKQSIRPCNHHISFLHRNTYLHCIICIRHFWMFRGVNHFPHLGILDLVHLLEPFFRGPANELQRNVEPVLIWLWEVNAYEFVLYVLSSPKNSKLGVS